MFMSKYYTNNIVTKPILGLFIPSIYLPHLCQWWQGNWSRRCSPKSWNARKDTSFIENNF